MGLKLLNYKYCGLPAPDAYAKVIYPASMANPVIGVGFYASKAARDYGETALAFVQYAIPEPVPMNPPGEIDPGIEYPIPECNDPGIFADIPIEMTPGPAQWFAEDALEEQGITPLRASYAYIKTLPEFKDAVDVL